MKKVLSLFLAIAMVLGLEGCGSMSTTQKGTAIGAGGGAALGAAIGAIIGKGKGAAIGAAVGTIAGGTAGTLIGKKMQKQAEEIASNVNGAQVDTVTDDNGLTAIKVTFDNGILFATGKSALSTSAKTSLTKFAQSLQSNPETNVQIYGYTDNTGSREVNERLSAERASVVLNYLANAGISTSRMASKGYAWDYPVASNDTPAGRAQNRRVEVYISANASIVQKANNGTLK